MIIWQQLLFFVTSLLEFQTHWIISISLIIWYCSDNMMNGIIHDVWFEVIDNIYIIPYWLINDIYPNTHLLHQNDPKYFDQKDEIIHFQTTC